MRVKNLVSPRSGRKVANQFEINADEKRIFQSYDSTIVEIDYGNRIIAIGEDYDYSMTTGKYRNQFFADNGFRGLSTKQGLEKAMAEGRYENFVVTRL